MCEGLMETYAFVCLKVFFYKVASHKKWLKLIDSINNFVDPLLDSSHPFPSSYSHCQ